MRIGTFTSLVCIRPGDPTPAEIAEHCRLIQLAWSPPEFYRRAGQRPPPWLGRKNDLQANAWAAPVLAMGGGMSEPHE